MKKVAGILLLSIIFFAGTTSVYAAGHVTLKPGTSLTLRAHEETEVLCEKEDPNLPKCRMVRDKEWFCLYLDDSKFFCYISLDNVLDMIIKMKTAGQCR